MAGLGKLVVAKAPAALSATAIAHNALVHLIESMKGARGIKVTVTEGNILIELAPAKDQGTGGSSGSGSATELHASSGSNSVDITASAITTTNGSASFSVNVTSGAVTITNLGTGNYLQIDPSLINHNLTIREIDVCDSGVAKKMLVLGSAPY